MRVVLIEYLGTEECVERIGSTGTLYCFRGTGSRQSVYVTDINTILRERDDSDNRLFTTR